MPEEFSTRICISLRAAMKRLKRWFYGVIYRNAPDDKKELCKQNWAVLARLIIDAMNKRGCSDLPGRIRVVYEVRDGVFTPIKAVVEAYKKVDEFEVEVSKEALEKAAEVTEPEIEEVSESEEE